MVEYKLGRIDYVSPDGAVKTFVVDPYGPYALAWDGKKYLYTTVQGGMVRRYTLDGQGTTFATGFISPFALAFDSQGNLYVADARTASVSKVTPSGTVSTFVSFDPRLHIERPTSLAFDRKDNLYVSLGQNPPIAVVSPSGTIHTLGSGLTNCVTYSGISTCIGPGALAVDNQDGLYAAVPLVGSSTSIIDRVAPDDTVSLFAKDLNNPASMTFDDNGILYVSSYDSGTIYRITQDGKVSEFVTGLNLPMGLSIGPPPHIPPVRPDCTVITLAGAGTPGDAVGEGAVAMFNAPNGGFVDTAGNAWVADNNNHRIKKVAPSGLVSAVAGGGIAGFADGPAAEALFHNPIGVCTDGTGNTYVADFGNHRIRRVSAAGEVSTVAGNGTAGYADGAATNAQFNAPNDLVLDKSGNLFVSDFQNHVVRKITPAGVVTTWAGHGEAGYRDGAGTNAVFNQPSGIAIDAAGNLFVTEWSGQRVRKIDPSGLVSTVAGDGTPGLRDDWNLLAKFNHPDGIVVGSDGNIYIADNGNNAIRRLDLDGYVLTITGTGSQGFVDGSSDKAKLFSPTGIGWGKDGSLFFIDSGNNAVRQIVWGSNQSAEMAIRHLPAQYVGGGEVRVVLELHPPADVLSFTVTETIPMEWSVVAASDGGTFDNATGKLTFGPFSENRVRALSYTLGVPIGDSGTKQFSGTITHDGADFAIVGSSQIQLAENADLLSTLNATVASGGKLMLTFDGNISLTNTLEITQDLLLDGAGHNVTLSGNKAMRLFNIHPNVTLTLLNLTLADGRAQGAAANEANDPVLLGFGGCIANEGGTVTLSNCLLTANFAFGGNINFRNDTVGRTGGFAFGGAIYNHAGKLTLIGTTIQDGGAQGGNGMSIFLTTFSHTGMDGSAFGGAICSLGGSVTLQSSIFTRNNAVGGPFPSDSFSRGQGAAFGGALFTSNTVLTVSNSVFSGNQALSPTSYWSGGVGEPPAAGGALYLQAGTSDVSFSTFTSNSTLGNGLFNSVGSGGGAIFCDTKLALAHCQFLSNSMSGENTRSGVAGPGVGGAILNNGDATITESTFTSNTAIGGAIPQIVAGGSGGFGMGGAIYNGGHLVLLNNTFAYNSAGGGTPMLSTEPNSFGGALFDSGATFVSNNTFYANLATNAPPLASYYNAGAGLGGAIYGTNVTMVLVNSTLAGNNVNTNGMAGGLWITNSSVTVKNSILANPSGNCVGSVIDGGHNISSDASCNFTSPGSSNTMDPILGKLDDYGGSTWTMPLLFGSPAIDQGDDTTAPSTDQRGRARPFGKASDIGAFESAPPFVIRGQLASFMTLTNVEIRLNSSVNATISSGSFVLNGLASGSYDLTPSLTNYLFLPAQLPVTVGPDRFGLELQAYRLNSLSADLSSADPTHFVLAGKAGETWQMQASTNLVNWQAVSSGTIQTNGLLPFSDSLLNHPFRFYRAQR